MTSATTTASSGAGDADPGRRTAVARTCRGRRCRRRAGARRSAARASAAAMAVVRVVRSEERAEDRDEADDDEERRSEISAERLRRTSRRSRRSALRLRRGDVGGWGDRGHESRTFGLSAACARSMSRLTMTTMTAVTITTPMTIGMSPAAWRCTVSWPRPGRAKTCSMMMAPPRRPTNCSGEHGQRGAAGVAQHVLVHDAVRAEAAAAQRAHVVAATARR